MREEMPIRQILLEKLRYFNIDDNNLFDNPINQILSFCSEFNVLYIVRLMANRNVNVMSKSQWKKLVWERAWLYENNQWDLNVAENQKFDLIIQVSLAPGYSVWWSIADQFQGFMRKCETMVKFLCHASHLKCDDVRLIRASFWAKSCTLCENAAYEDVNHMIMQCSYHSDTHREMYEELNRIIPNIETMCSLGVLLGKCIDGWEYGEMDPILMVLCTYIVEMYYEVLNSRTRDE